MTNDPYHAILREVCEEEEIRLTELSDDWVLLLEKDGKQKFIVGYGFDLTTKAAGQIADDKYATFAVLKEAGLPTIAHELLYEAGNTQAYVQGRNTTEYVEKLLEKWGHDIVIKPNNGKMGENVFRVRTIQEVPKVLEKVFHQCYSASVCPFCEIQHEYRIVLLDGEEQLSYRKTRGEDWRFNLKHGARADRIIDEQLHETLRVLAQKVAWALGLRFCSVDIIQTSDGELLVLEVNSGVMVEKYLAQNPGEYEKVKAMYRRAIQKMFATE